MERTEEEKEVPVSAGGCTCLFLEEEAALGRRSDLGRNARRNDLRQTTT